MNQEQYLNKIDVLCAILKTAEISLYEYLDGKEFVNSDVIRKSYRDSEAVFDACLKGTEKIEIYRDSITKWKDDVITTYNEKYGVIKPEEPKQKRRQMVF